MNMKNSLIALFFTLFSFALFAQQKSLDFKQDEVIIQLKENVNIDDFLKDFKQNNPTLASLNVKKELVRRLNMYLLGFDTEEADFSIFLERLNEQAKILAVQLNYALVFRDSIPDDPFFNEQWPLERIQAPDAWTFSTGGKDPNGEEIVIAILDSGFDIANPDLVENLWSNGGEIPMNGIDDDGNGHIDDMNGWNFKNDLPQHPLGNGHGTSVAGIAGARGNNGLSVTGVNWEVKLMLLTGTFVDQIIASYGYVLEQRILFNETNGAEGAYVVVTNASFGLNNTFCSEQPIWGAMYDILGEVGVVSIGATTNNSSIDVDINGDMPTSCESEYLITVTYSNIDEQREGGFGETSIDLTAPGKGSVTLSLNGDFDFGFNGTSAASPLVAGSVGLLYSMPCQVLADLALENPAEAALLVKKAILEGTDKYANLTEETVSGGRLNLFNSAEYLHSYCIANDREKTEDIYAETYIGNPRFVRIYSEGEGSDRFFVDFSTMDFEPVEIAIFNAVGQRIWEEKMQPDAFVHQTYSFDAFGWAAGVYFITVRGVDEKVTGKFMKI